MRLFTKHSRLSCLGLSATAALILASPTTGLAQTAINEAMPQKPVGFPSAGGSVAVKTDSWYNLSTEYHSRPGIPSQVEPVDVDSIFDVDGNKGDPWLNPVYSQVFSSASSTTGLTKIANGDGGYTLNDFNPDGTTKAGAIWNSTSTIGPYFSSKSLYNQGSSTLPNARAGTLGIFESAPVDQLAALAFQIEIGPAYDYDLVNNNTSGLNEGHNFDAGALASIGLSLNLTFGDESTLTLNADSGTIVKKVYSETQWQMVDGTLTPLDVYIHLYDFRWDLSAYDDITAFNVSFDVVDHSSIYMMRLDQAAIPEPSTWAFLATSGIILLISLKKRAVRRAA